MLREYFSHEFDKKEGWMLNNHIFPPLIFQSLSASWSEKNAGSIDVRLSHPFTGPSLNPNTKYRVKKRIGY